MMFMLPGTLFASAPSYPQLHSAQILQKKQQINKTFKKPLITAFPRGEHKLININ